MPAATATLPIRASAREEIDKYQCRPNKICTIAQTFLICADVDFPLVNTFGEREGKPKHRAASGQVFRLNSSTVRLNDGARYG